MTDLTTIRIDMTIYIDHCEPITIECRSKLPLHLQPNHAKTQLEYDYLTAGRAGIVDRIEKTFSLYLHSIINQMRTRRKNNEETILKQASRKLANQYAEHLKCFGVGMPKCLPGGRG